MSDIKLIKIPASLDGVSPRKDGSMSLRFVTNEMTADQKTSLMALYNTFGWLIYADSVVNEVPREPPKEVGAKTPSTRLRNVLYLIWGEKHSDVPFNSYYEQTMEKIIDRAKKELPPK